MSFVYITLEVAISWQEENFKHFFQWIISYYVYKSKPHSCYYQMLELKPLYI